jgi:acetyl-CoA carboxylase biotin carboxyl carrier protein
MAKFEAKSEVNGAVWKIQVQPGQKVGAGDTLVLIESMKMEIPVIADEDGTVVSVQVKEGDPVVEGQVIVMLEG